MNPSLTTAASRLSRCFSELRRTGELGLVAYITAGDPSIEATERFVMALANAGADVIELGVPFSDPVADGPTIQRASERALQSGTTLSGVLTLVRKIRARTEIPLVIFTYFNPILQMGIQSFADAAVEAGADGVLVTDLTPEESEDYRRILHGAGAGRGLDTIFLVAPTSSDARMRRISDVSTGFLYVISRTGVTGESNSLADELPALLRRVRAATSLPIAVGFGISQPGHVSILGGLADAAVVGSALVAEIEGSANVDAAVAAVSARAKLLKQAARQGMSRRE